MIISPLCDKNNSSKAKIRKRATLFANEVKKFHELQPNVNCAQYGDRFIPRRRPMLKCTPPDTAKTREKEYEVRLRSAFGIADTNCRQLTLSDPKIPRPFFISAHPQNFYYFPHSTEAVPTNKYKDMDWICRPRQRPCIDADSSHEFESFVSPAIGNLIQWAWTGHLVTHSLNNALLLWNPNEDVITKYDFRYVLTLAYHPFLSFLATSNEYRGKYTVNVWSFEMTTVVNFFDVTPKPASGPVMSLVWHKQGQHLLCGDEQGYIWTLDIHRSKKIINRSHGKQSLIKDLKFSATFIYLASLDTNGKLTVWYYNGGYLKILNSWESYHASLVSFDWHPWNEHDMAICIQSRAVLLILNVLSKTTEASRHHFCHKFIQPVISFNKTTAELVLTVQQISKKGVKTNDILVLGALDQVVDEIPNAGIISTQFMWNPTHDQLAFITGKDIQIYNFFGPIKKREDQQHQQSSTNVLNVHSQENSIFKQYECIK